MAPEFRRQVRLVLSARYPQTVVIQMAAEAADHPPVRLLYLSATALPDEYSGVRAKLEARLAEARIRSLQVDVGSAVPLFLRRSLRSTRHFSTMTCRTHWPARATLLSRRVRRPRWCLE